MDKLEVDIADPAAIDDAIDRVEVAIRANRNEYAHLLQLRTRLQALGAYGEGSRAPVGARRTATEEVIQELEKLGEPARARDLEAKLPDIPRKTISWALWKAESEGRVKKISHGVYASLGHERETLLAAEE